MTGATVSSSDASKVSTTLVSGFSTAFSSAIGATVSSSGVSKVSTTLVSGFSTAVSSAIGATVFSSGVSKGFSGTGFWYQSEIPVRPASLLGTFSTGVPKLSM